VKIENISKRQISAAVALAIGAGVAASSMAATIVAGSAVYSTEYSSNATANAASQALVVANAGTLPTFTSGAAYQTSDAVTITLSNASFSTASAPSVVCAGPVTLSPAASSVTTTSSQITFNVANALGSGALCTLYGASVTNASLATANTAGIKLGLGVARGGVTVDVGADATLGSAQATLAIAASGRFAGVVANFGRTNAGENGRFLTGATQDPLATIAATQLASVNPVTLVAASAFTLTLSSSASGGMGWLKNGTATSCDVSTNANTINPSASTTVAASDGSCTSVIITRADGTGTAAALDVPGTGATTVLTMTVGNASGNYMTAQSFTATGNWNFTAGAGVTASKAIALNMGSFTQNGTRVFIPYMPRGAGISHVVTLANTSSTTGTATISGIRSDGAVCGPSNFGTVALAANRITSLSSAVVTGLNACGASTGDSQSFALTVTVNAPADNIEVYSMYNVNGNRVSVINSSNGRGPVNTAGTAVAGTGNANSDQ